MVQSKEFVDASHALNDLSHALDLLESENASLRGAVDGLCNENAKLRELVRDMWKDACQFDSFWDYVHDDGEIYNEDELPHYQERMRELGVEVSE